MTEETYNKRKGIRRSDLWKLNRSPAHFQYAKEHPVEQTAAMAFGSAVHEAVLTPRTFRKRYQMADFDARTKEGKAMKQAALDAGKILLTKDQWEQIQGIVSAIKAHPYAKRLLTGKHETAHFWKDPETGLKCKCKTDCETDVGGTHYVVDLKTCGSADTDEFVRDAVKFGYFMQAAMYTDGVKCCTGQDSVFVFVCVEKDPPYAVNVLQCGEDEIRLGMNGDKRGTVMGYRQLMELYNRCLTEKKWPGYEGFENKINQIQLPKWLKEE